MKWTEWLIALALVAIGVSCMTISGTLMLKPGSIQFYLDTFLRICLWIGIPVLIAIIVYWIFKFKRKKEK